MPTTRLRDGKLLCALLLTVAVGVVACGDDDEPTAGAASASASSETSEPSTDGAGTSPGASATAETPEQPAEELSVTMGGVPSSSSAFTMIVAHARVAGEVDGNMTMNVRETGASNENIQLVQDGAIDFGLSGPSTLIQAYEGLGPYEGNADKDLCMLQVWQESAYGIIVLADEGIDTFADLEGKPFNPGFQGSTPYDVITEFLRILEIEVDVFEGSLEDVVNAMKDDRIVGFVKSANGFGPDASMLDVASSRSVKAIGLTEEDVEKIYAAAPENRSVYFFGRIPPGSMFDNTDELLVPPTAGVYFADGATMPEDVQYRLTRAFAEGQEDAATQVNYAASMGITADNTIKYAEQIPLCAGAQRYFEEVGAL